MGIPVEASVPRNPPLIFFSVGLNTIPLPLCIPFVILAICPLLNSFVKPHSGASKGNGISIPLPKILSIPRLPKADNASVAK